MAAAQVSILLGAKGPTLAPVTACSIGNTAIGEAFKLIQRGGADVVLAGGAEAIALIKTLREGIVPPTINYEHPDPDCDLDCVPNTAREVRIQPLKNPQRFFPLPNYRPSSYGWCVVSCDLRNSEGVKPVVFLKTALK